MLKFREDPTMIVIFDFTDEPTIIIMIGFTDEPTIIRKDFYRRSDDHNTDFVAKFYRRSDDHNMDFLATFTEDPTITVFYFVPLILP